MLHILSHAIIQTFPVSLPSVGLTSFVALSRGLLLANLEHLLVDVTDHDTGTAQGILFIPVLVGNFFPG